MTTPVICYRYIKRARGPRLWEASIPRFKAIGRTRRDAGALLVAVAQERGIEPLGVFRR